jgi:phage tail sheath protein FI
MHQHLGVYVEEIPSGQRPTEVTSMSTAFIIAWTGLGAAANVDFWTPCGRRHACQSR